MPSPVSCSQPLSFLEVVWRGKGDKEKRLQCETISPPTMGIKYNSSPLLEFLDSTLKHCLRWLCWVKTKMRAWLGLWRELTPAYQKISKNCLFRICLHVHIRMYFINFAFILHIQFDPKLLDQQELWLDGKAQLNEVGNWILVRFAREDIMGLLDVV